MCVVCVCAQVARFRALVLQLTVVSTPMPYEGRATNCMLQVTSHPHKNFLPFCCVFAVNRQEDVDALNACVVDGH